MVSTSYDILAIGNSIVDILVQVDETFLVDHDRTKASMMLVDEDLSKKLYDAIPPAIEQSGGSAGNTAAGAASFGARVAYIGKVHDDQLGRVFSHDIRAAGVSFKTSPLTEGPATATSIILITPDAQRTMNTFLGACADLAPADIDETTVATASVTYVEGYLWDREKAKAAVIKAMDLAHQHGREVALTLSDSFCVDRFRSEFQTLVREKVDILFANEAEILSLYESNDLDKVLEQLKNYVKVAAITLSEKGSLVLMDGVYTEIAAAPADVIDTTGAGDLYAAGFLYGYTKSQPAKICGALGSLAAAEVISHVGARPLVSLKDLAAEKIKNL